MKKNQLNNEILGVFKPKFYPLHDLNLIIIVLIVLLVLEFPIVFSIGIAVGGGYILLVSLGVSILITIILIGYLIYLRRSYPTMSYTLYENKLILRCGIFKSIIFYSQIKKVYEKVVLSNYFLLVKGAISLDNLALGSIYFCGYGWITLYATDYKHVIVIETEKKRYGITPQEPERFLSELKSYIENVS